VQTTALPLSRRIEPRSALQYFGQALLGAGVDIGKFTPAPRRARLTTCASCCARLRTQWRSAGELTLGVLRKGELLSTACTHKRAFSFGDIHYSVAIGHGEQAYVAVANSTGLIAAKVAFAARRDPRAPRYA